MSFRNSFTQSKNPVMRESIFRDAAQTQSGAVAYEEKMTVQGAINKTFLLLAILLVTTIWSFANPNPLFMWGGAIGGLIVVLIAAFRPQHSPVLAPLYAALKGLFVGAVSAIYAAVFSGIIFQAVTLTMAVLFLMLFLYKSGLIKVTEKFRAGVIMATGAIFLVYLVTLVLSLFGITVPYIHQGGAIGIGISLVIVGVAAMNLLLDFDNFEKGEQYGAPIYMEWFSAMGLLITLVWLYIEILRLVAMFSSRD
jgi:uncharacterized YccA/Bax inhibitor family protein